MFTYMNFVPLCSLVLVFFRNFLASVFNVKHAVYGIVQSLSTQKSHNLYTTFKHYNGICSFVTAPLFPYHILNNLYFFCFVATSARCLRSNARKDYALFLLHKLSLFGLNDERLKNVPRILISQFIP